MTAHHDSPPPANTPDTSPQGATVRDAIMELFAGWSTHDPVAFGDVFPDDAEYTDVVGNHVRGPKGIAALHVFPFRAMFAGATLTLTELRERELTEGWVTVDALWQVGGHTAPTGTPLPTWEGVMHVITVQRDGLWRPLIVHNVSLTTHLTGAPGPVDITLGTPPT